MKLIAHQGTRIFAPGNSIPAFLFAAKAGFYAINFAQVRASADGTLYVMHDPTVDKMTNGTGGIANLHDSDIASLRIDRRENYAEYAFSDFSENDLRIPTLEDGIRICVRYGCRPMIRLGICPEGNETAFENLYGLIKTYGIADKMLLSGSADTMAALDADFPDIPKIVFSPTATVPEIVSVLDGFVWQNRNTVYAMLKHDKLDAESIRILNSAGYSAFSANPGDMKDPESARQRYAELERDGCIFANAERSPDF